MMPLGTNAPDFSLLNIDNNTVSLSDLKDYRALVIMFICNHCPYVIHVKDQIIEIANDYTDKEIAFIAINSNDPDYDPSDSFENMKREGYPFPYLYDEDQSVAKAYKAACTPDIYVFDNNKKLVYRGQLDDSRPGNNEPNDGKDLRNALDAIIDSRSLEIEQKPSSGCNIKWKPGNEPN